MSPGGSSKGVLRGFFSQLRARWLEDIQLAISRAGIAGRTINGGNVAGALGPGVTTSTGASIGTVSSVGLNAPPTFTVTSSPVTGSGTIALAYATEPANEVFAGPSSGAAAAPTFRAIVSADIPANIGLTTPEITTGLKDANGALILGFVPDAGADDYLTIANGDGGTFSTMVISANGTDANITIRIAAKGSGTVLISSKLITVASSTTAAGFNLPSGTAPTSPADGDLWYDGTNLKFRQGGTTKTVTLT